MGNIGQKLRLWGSTSTTSALSATEPLQKIPPSHATLPDVQAMPPTSSIADHPGETDQIHAASSSLFVLTEEYTRLWKSCFVLPAWDKEATNSALKAIESKHRYDVVSAKTGAPWYFIAAIHYRECSFSWSGCLHNGDPWDQVTVDVPAGRGPWNSWEDAAVDAIMYEAGISDWDMTKWDIGRVFWRLEAYNGFGYRTGPTKDFICKAQYRDHVLREGTFSGIYHGSMQDTTPRNASPYVYCGTQFYEKGISLEDHSFYPNAKEIDNIGVMALLQEIENQLGEPLF